MSDDSREMGVEFGELTEDLEDEEFPVGKGALLDDYGDREITMEDDSTTLAELIEPLGVSEFEDPQAVQRSVVTMIGEEAVGRKGYSDRGGQGGDEADGAESI